MEFCNYIRLEKKSITYAYFLFIDVTEYLADRIFIKHKVKVGFGKEYAKEGSKYLCISCKIKKRDEGKFLEALEELKNIMLLCGYVDYLDFCASIIGES